MQHQDYTPVYEEVNMENLTGVNIQKGSIEDVKDVFDYDKDSQTIQKEIEHFEKEGATPEQEQSFGFDDFGEDESGNLGLPQVETQVEEEVEEVGEIEDYYDSAEFIIFVTEIILVFTTNFYLKYNKLEKITIDAFNKTKAQHKLLVKSWAAVLQKHNAKVSVELQLVMALGSAYGMKLSNIVQQQKAKAYDKLMELKSNNGVKKATPVKEKKEDNPVSSGIVSFDVDFDNVEEEDNEHKKFRDNMFKEEEDIKIVQQISDKEKAKKKENKKKTSLIDLS